MKNLEVRQQSAMESGKCGRDSKNTGLLKKYPLLVVTGLLLWTATAWGQQLFGDRIYGSAVACVGNHYSKTGSTKHGYDLTGKTADSCKYGSANAASKAQIGPPVISASTTAISKKGGYSEGAGSADSYDEAILKSSKRIPRGQCAGDTGNGISVRCHLDSSRECSLRNLLDDYRYNTTLRGCGQRQRQTKASHGL